MCRLENRSPDFISVRAAMCWTPPDHFAQVRLSWWQTLHADVWVFELHGPFARGGLHRTGSSCPSLRLLVHLPCGWRLLDQNQSLAKRKIIKRNNKNTTIFYYYINPSLSLSLYHCHLYRPSSIHSLSLSLSRSFYKQISTRFTWSSIQLGYHRPNKTERHYNDHLAVHEIGETLEKLWPSSTTCTQTTVLVQLLSQDWTKESITKNIDGSDWFPSCSSGKIGKNSF